MTEKRPSSNNVKRGTRSQKKTEKGRLAVSPGAFEPLFNALSNCPPWLLKFGCENSGQTTAFVETQQFCIDLKQALTCFYAGLPLPSYKNKDYESLVMLKLSEYLRLHEVISFGWAFLTEVPFNTPGELLKEITSREAEFMFRQSQARWKDFTPGAYREESKFLGQLERKGLSGETFSLTEKSRLKGQLAKKNAQRVNPELLYLQNWCIEELEHAKNPTRQLKAALKAYKVAVGDIEEFLASYYHERKKRRGFQIVKGVRSIA
jgi:hypothetical protein